MFHLFLFHNLHKNNFRFIRCVKCHDAFKIIRYDLKLKIIFGKLGVAVAINVAINFLLKNDVILNR